MKRLRRLQQHEAQLGPARVSKLPAPMEPPCPTAETKALTLLRSQKRIMYAGACRPAFREQRPVVNSDNCVGIQNTDRVCLRPAHVGTALHVYADYMAARHNDALACCLVRFIVCIFTTANMVSVTRRVQEKTERYGSRLRKFLHIVVCSVLTEITRAASVPLVWMQAKTTSLRRTRYK